MEKNLTTGSVLKTIIYFALPYLLSYFLQTLYGMADLYITGQFNGVDSITAVSNGSQVMHMLTVIIVGLAMGTTVIIGKAIGGNKLDNAGRAIGNTITLFMGIAIVMTIVFLIAAKLIVLLIGVPQDAVAGTVRYLIICFIGIPFITAYNIISSIFRGLDDAAAVGIVEKMISAIFIIPSSMLATVSALSAQNIGAGKYDRAAKTLKYATMITSVYGVFMAVIMQVLAAPLLALFTKDAAVVVLGTQYMKGYIIDSIFAGVHFCFSGYFAAYGKSYIGFMHNIISITFVRVPGSYLASKLFGDTLFPMGLAAPAGSLLSVIICVCAYIYLKRSGKLEPVAA